MSFINKTLPFLGAVALSTACIGDDGTGTSDTDNGTSGTAGPMTTANTTENADTTMGVTTMGGTADSTATSDTGPDTGTADESSSDGVDPDVFIFDDADPGDYTQQDRVGFPAINTGLNLLGDKDAYNASTPALDISEDTARDNAVDSLLLLHAGPAGGPDGVGLDDDLAGAGLTPCSITLGGVDCLDQAGPFALPDTMNFTLGAEVGFPNGRGLEAPVIDIILAVLLLDIGAPPTFNGPMELTTFIDLDADPKTPGPSLNPLANDVAFPGEWPYLAPAQEP